jgi:hypothetical protein
LAAVLGRNPSISPSITTGFLPVCAVPKQAGFFMSIDLELSKMMEEELEKAYPNSDSEPDHEISEREQDLLDQFATEFDDELQGPDAKKMMFSMDVAIHVGETPDQLRQIIDEKGVEAIYQARMAIHLASKDLGVTYLETGKIVGDLIYGTEKGTRLH